MLSFVMVLSRHACPQPVDVSRLVSSFVAPTNFQRLTNCLKFATHFEPLSYQRITNCPICKSFFLITIQQYRGCTPSLSQLAARHSSLAAHTIPFAFINFCTLLHSRISQLLSFPCGVPPALESAISCPIQKSMNPAGCGQ